MNKRVIITGAGGFIGHHLARYLKLQGDYVIGIDLNTPLFSGMDDFNEFHIVDLRLPVKHPSFKSKVDCLYALAAQNGSIEYTTTNKADLMRDNALININTAEACIDYNIKRLFFSSSACVYPVTLQDHEKASPLKEEDAYPANPDSEYGWEKLFSERLYQSYAFDHGLEVRIARFFNIYGPECVIDTLRSKAPMALTRKVIQAKRNGTVDVWGSGKAIRSYCYISDCVRAIHMLMESDIKEPINIGTDDHISVDALVNMICALERPSLTINHQLDKVEGVKERLCDFSKAKNLLKWEPRVSPMTGLSSINTFVHKQIDEKF